MHLLYSSSEADGPMGSYLEGLDEGRIRFLWAPIWANLPFHQVLNDKLTIMCSSCLVFCACVCFCFYVVLALLQLHNMLAFSSFDCAPSRLGSVEVPLHSAHMPTVWEEAECLKTVRWKEIERLWFMSAWDSATAVLIHLLIPLAARG